jgi:probable LLM family oxidoreductase
MMELGIDRFLFSLKSERGASFNPVPDLMEEVELADRLGLDVFGIGEHHTGEFSDSAPPVLLAAAAARTSRIRLSSAITILGVADPVRVFEDFATLDLVSNGRAEIVAGRGAYAEAFSLFGLDLANYDELFAEKLDLLLRLRGDAPVHWSGRHRPSLTGQIAYPRPVQPALPIWIGATGTPSSFVRAGALGLPLALGIVGGDFERLRPLVELYRTAGRHAGHAAETLKVAIHAIGYVASSRDAALQESYPAYHHIFGDLARKAGWPELTRSQFELMTEPGRALVVGSPNEVAQKMSAVSALLGGISRFCLQMSLGPLDRALRLRTIELLAGEVRARFARS